MKPYLRLGFFSLLISFLSLREVSAMPTSGLPATKDAPQVSQLAARGGHEGNGGAGVLKSGAYMTFYSAGLYVEPINRATGLPPVIPGLDELFTYMSNLKFLSRETKAKFLEAIEPSMFRTYQVAVPSELTPEVYSRLLGEFRRVTGIDPSQMKLFALTDAPKRVTYLLPEFFGLSLPEQMTILFHENYWLVYPSATYDQVVAAEMSFQAALMGSDNPARIYDFVTKIGATSIEVSRALTQWELAAGSLKGFLDENSHFTMGQLYGHEYWSCVKEKLGYSVDRQFEVCGPYFRRNVNSLIRNFPNSMILRRIADQLSLQSKAEGVECIVRFDTYETANTWRIGGFLRNCTRIINRNDRPEHIDQLVNCKVQVTPDKPAPPCKVTDYSTSTNYLLELGI